MIKCIVSRPGCPFSLVTWPVPIQPYEGNTRSPKMTRPELFHVNFVPEVHCIGFSLLYKL